MLGVSQGHANVRDNEFDKALENNHTLATVLKQAGYATVIIGKWGLQGVGAGETNPATRGRRIQPGAVLTTSLGTRDIQTATSIIPKKGRMRKANRFGMAPMTSRLNSISVTPPISGQRAPSNGLSITKHSSPAQPFFMYLAYDTPHATTELPTQSYPDGGGLHGGLQWLGTPGHMINTASGTIDSWMYPEYQNATYDDDHNPATPEVPWPDVYKRYATDVRRIGMDAVKPDLKQLLQDLKIDNDTLVIFTSDNGPSIESYLGRAGR